MALRFFLLLGLHLLKIRKFKRGDQISDIPCKPPPDLRTGWSKSLGNFGSASTSDALRDFLKKKNVFVIVIVVVIVFVIVIVIDI